MVRGGRPVRRLVEDRAIEFKHLVGAEYERAGPVRGNALRNLRSLGFGEGVGDFTGHRARRRQPPLDRRLVDGGRHYLERQAGIFHHARTGPARRSQDQRRCGRPGQGRRLTHRRPLIRLDRAGRG